MHTGVSSLTTIPYCSLTLTLNVQDGRIVPEPSPSGTVWHCGAAVCFWKSLEEVSVLALHDGVGSCVHACPTGRTAGALPLLGRPRSHHQQRVYFSWMRHILRRSTVHCQPQEGFPGVGAETAGHASTSAQVCSTLSNELWPI